MADGVVTTGALQTFGFAVDHVAVDFCRDVLVTAAASILRDLYDRIS